MRRQRRVALHRAVRRDEDDLIRRCASHRPPVASANQNEHRDDADQTDEHADAEPGDHRRDGLRQLEREHRQPRAELGQRSARVVHIPQNRKPTEGHHPPGQVIRQPVGFPPHADFSRSFAAFRG